MTAAYVAGGWTDFGATIAATAATMVGLLFVAVSINLQRILKFPHLPSRAAQTLILFVTPLLVGILLLAPGQSRAALAVELLVTGVLVGACQLVIHARTPRSEAETRLTRLVGRVLPPIVSCGSLAIAGCTLLAQAGGGLYWLLPSVLAAIIFGLLNAWVLLVEILR